MYDQIIPFEDYTNLWIIGVTVALAYELPDSPHIPEKHHEHDEQNKTRVFQRKKLVNHKNSTEYGIHSGSLHQRDRNDSDYALYFNRGSYHHDRRIESEHRDFLVNQIKLWQNKRKNGQFLNAVPLGVKRHLIYPALRMRRNIEEKWNGNGDAHPETIGYLKHHRATRFKLFRSIEKYLNA